MSVTQLVIREICYRKLNFALALLSVTVAVACVIGAQALLRSDEIQTATILQAKQAEIETAIQQREEQVTAAGKELQDAIRKQMLGLGFNVLVLPEGQDLSELHLQGTLSDTMPESYVDKLANSRIVTVNHLLPSVTKRVEIAHNGIQTDVILQGTRGEVPIMHRGLKKPLLDAVPPGTMVAGSGIAEKLKLSVGEKVQIGDKEFEVTTIHPERGSSDDVTVWVDLRQAQQLLGMENLINAILALECECAGDRISQIRGEIAKILPGTKVIERYSKALARAESRAKAKQTAEEALRQEKANGTATLDREQEARLQIEQRHAGLVVVMTPLVLVVCSIWIGVLAFTNVRQRTSEIGILRALGLRGQQILTLFLSRAFLTGLLGGVAGCVIGLSLGASLGGLAVSAESVNQLFESGSLLLMSFLAPVFAPLFSAIASWLPALFAAQQDPALILQSS